MVQVNLDLLWLLQNLMTALRGIVQIVNSNNNNLHLYSSIKPLYEYTVSGWALQYCYILNLC